MRVESDSLLSDMTVQPTVPTSITAEGALRCPPSVWGRWLRRCWVSSVQFLFKLFASAHMRSSESLKQFPCVGFTDDDR